MDKEYVKAIDKFIALNGTDEEEGDDTHSLIYRVFGKDKEACELLIRVTIAWRQGECIVQAINRIYQNPGADQLCGHCIICCPPPRFLSLLDPREAAPPQVSVTSGTDTLVVDPFVESAAGLRGKCPQWMKLMKIHKEQAEADLVWWRLEGKC
jgi:hypothetical protein